MIVILLRKCKSSIVKIALCKANQPNEMTLGRVIIFQSLNKGLEEWALLEIPVKKDETEKTPS